jgi:hypothetical protein
MTLDVGVAAYTFNEFLRAYIVCILQLITGDLPVCEPVNSFINSFSTQIVERPFQRGFEILVETPKSWPCRSG